MKCKTCGGQAVINMRHHKLSLCRDHYLRWFIDYTERTIHKYHMLEKTSPVLIAVSGGKDSLALWDVLNRLGYQTVGLHIDLGIQTGVNYSQRSIEFTRRFADSHALVLHIFSVEQELGSTVEELITRVRRGEKRPCAVCGTIKRRIFDRITVELGIPGMATGHNLDDEAAVLFGNTMDWRTDQMQRQAPVLIAHDGFPQKVKPFCRFYERETAAYTILTGIDYIEDECPFAIGSRTNEVKSWLNDLEAAHPGLKLNFYSRFLAAKQDSSLQFQESRPIELHPCQNCGQMTSSDRFCSFCKLFPETNQAVSR